MNREEQAWAICIEKATHDAQIGMHSSEMKHAIAIQKFIEMMVPAGPWIESCMVIRGAVRELEIERTRPRLMALDVRHNAKVSGGGTPSAGLPG
jgi:hypothetical protein